MQFFSCNRPQNQTKKKTKNFTTTQKVASNKNI